MAKTETQISEKTVMKREAIETLARVLEPFSPVTDLSELSGFVLFENGRARMSDGVIGVDIAFDALDGYALPVVAFVSSLLSLKSDVQMYVKDDHVFLNGKKFIGRFTGALRKRCHAWPDIPAKNIWTALPVGIWTAAQSVSFVADTKQRQAFSVVKVSPGQVYAIDTARLARSAAKNTQADLLFPLKLLDACVKAFPDTAPNAIASDASDRVWLRFGDTVVWSLLPAGDFPTDVLPAVVQRSKQAGAGYSARWVGAKAQAALARVAPFAKDSLTVIAEGKTLKFSAQSQRGSAEDSVEAEVVRPFKIEVNPVILADALGRAECCAATDDGQCLVFRRTGWELILMAMAPTQSPTGVKE